MLTHLIHDGAWVGGRTAETPTATLTRAAAPRALTAVPACSDAKQNQQNNLTCNTSYNICAYRIDLTTQIANQVQETRV